MASTWPPPPSPSSSSSSSSLSSSSFVNPWLLCQSWQHPNLTCGIINSSAFDDAHRRRCQPLAVIRRNCCVGLFLLSIVVLLVVFQGLAFHACHHWVNDSDTSRLQSLLRLRSRYRQLLNQTVEEADAVDPESLHRLRQLGQEIEYKAVDFHLRQYEIRPTVDESIFWSATLVTVIGYGRLVGSSQLSQLLACFGIVLLVPLWFVCHHRLSLALQAAVVWALDAGQEALASNREALLAEHKCTCRHPSTSRLSFSIFPSSPHTAALASAGTLSSHFEYEFFDRRLYGCSAVLMLALAGVAFFLIGSVGCLNDRLWLTLQTVFHVGLGDVNVDKLHWTTLLTVMGLLFMAYFPCFGFYGPDGLGRIGRRRRRAGGKTRKEEEEQEEEEEEEEEGKEEGKNENKEWMRMPQGQWLISEERNK